MEEAIHYLLGNRVALGICRGLWTRKEGLSGRALAKVVGYSPQAVHNALKTLQDYKLVFSLPVGQSHLYTLNTKHFLLAEGLIPFWQRAAEWKDHLGTYYQKHLKPVPLSIVLYGSYAREAQTKASDFDILFIFNKEPSYETTAAIQELGDDVYQKFGVLPSVKAISLQKFKKEAKKKEGLMRTLYREGKVLAGKNLTEF